MAREYILWTSPLLNTNIQNMYRFSPLIIIIFLFFASCLVPPESPEDEETFSREEYPVPGDFDFSPQIARWYGFSPAAASLTFDDGTYDQYAAAWPVLEEEGVKGTFYLAAGLIEAGIWNDNGTERKMMSWENARTIASTGHEIGSHSLNHPDMTRRGTDIRKELEESRDLLEERITGIAVETFCWPHWRETPALEKEAEAYYISARSGNGIISYYLSRKGGIPSDPPVDMYAVNALGILRGADSGEWHSVADEILARGSWFVASYHGVEGEDLTVGETGWSSLPLEDFRDSVRFIRDRGFWVDTFSAVTKYIRERDAAEIRLSLDSDTLTLTVDDRLDDGIYNQPLTISLAVPDNWKTMTVRDSEGRAISGEVRENRLRLSIIPDGAALFLKPY